MLPLRVQIVDQGGKWSRGFCVPRYHNIPIYPEGIAGKDVISHLRESIYLLASCEQPTPMLLHHCDGELVKGEDAAIIDNGRIAILTTLNLILF